MSGPRGPVVVFGHKDTRDWKPGKKLLTRLNALKDDNGINWSTVKVQWLRDRVAIPSATERSYTITELDVGHTLGFEVEYADKNGATQRIASENTLVPDPDIEALHAIYWRIFKRRGDDAGVAFYDKLIKTKGWELSQVCADMEKNRDKHGAK